MSTRKFHQFHDLLLKTSKVISILLPGLTFIYLIAGFYIPSSINFSTSDSSCAFAPSLFPAIHNQIANDDFYLTRPAKISVFGYPILATHMCATPQAVPSSSISKIQIQQFRIPVSKTVSVNNRVSLYALPKINGDSVSTRSNLIFELSKPDVVFSYELLAGDRTADCHVQSDIVICPIRELSLEQGKKYNFQLKQTIGETSQPLFNQELATITSVEIIGSEIAQDSTVFQKLAEIHFKTSKPLDKIGGIKLSNDTELVETEAVVTEDGFVVRWTDELTRQKKYSLIIDQLAAQDGGHLETPYTLNFTMSGGPKVTNTTLSEYRTSLSPDFTLAFDSPLLSSQDFDKIILLSNAQGKIPTTITVNGDQLRIKTKTALPSCNDFTITISESLTSLYGVMGGNSYTSKHRTQCASEFSIGKSVEGRSIIGYKMGSGPKKILFLGAMHGNEKSGYYLLDSWLEYLEANPTKIPQGSTVIVIPKLNPDGFARNSRFNANNVDLNRNFASANWKSDVIVPGGALQAGAGGSAPTSEPESKAIAEYILSIQPNLVMSYHSQGSITIPNASGNSNSLALDYSKAVGYKYVSAEESLTEFEHETTGALEDWLHEVPDIPVVLNELSSHTTNTIFPYHRDPMLKVIN